MDKKTNSPSRLKTYFSGLLMGAADVVPGVSGGTVALILGIYQKLIESISLVDREFFVLLLQGKIKEALGRIHFEFLLFLGFGILTSIFSLSRGMVFLLKTYPVPTWAAFFGLIIASSILVAKGVGKFSFAEWGSFIIGAAGAFVLVQLNPIETSSGVLAIFLSAAIAICAMILPGISGSFILVLLGKYAFVMEAIKGFDLKVILVFGLGALLGLLLFSRVLKFLLKQHYSQTMAMMCGLMLGSLAKIWPFKESGEMGNLVNVIPQGMTLEVGIAILSCLVCLVGVIAIDHWVAVRLKKSL